MNKKLERFQERCEHDPAPIMEFIKEQLARGARPIGLADQWNTGIITFLVEARVDREEAIRIAVERVLLKFIERDGQATPDAVLFAARLKDRATGSRKSLRRTLQELEKRATAMLKEPTAWPLREEERTWKDLERKLQELPKKDTRYQRWSNSEFYVREPAENLGPNPGLVEGTPIGANRGVQPKAA